MQQRYNPEQLEAYREAGTALAEFSRCVDERLNAAAATGQLQDAKASLTELQVHTEELKKLRDELGPAGTFLATYNVVVHDEHTVSFVLPPGVSRMALLQEAQELVQDRKLIYPNQRIRWMKDPKFNKEAERSERICICGHVEGSSNMTRSEQGTLVGEENVPSLEDLAVAFAVHWIAIGEPLFGWCDSPEGRSYVVRAVGGELHFSEWGLSVIDIRDDLRARGLVAAAQPTLLPQRI